MPLPPPRSLSTLPPSTLTSLLDTLFEPSPALHALCLPLLRSTSRSFDTYPALIAAIERQLVDLSASVSVSAPPKNEADPTGEGQGQRQKGEKEEQFEEILNAHPRLGEKKVDSALSRAEQAGLSTVGGDQSKAREEERLAALNAAYEARFEGLRYVAIVSDIPSGEGNNRVFVNGRDRGTIMRDMEARIARGDVGLERREAIQV